MRRMRGTVLGSLILLFISGCASVETGKEWERVQETAALRTGKHLHWEKSEKERLAIREEVGRLLTGGVTREEAVQIALLNNRALQSRFEKIGIAKSDLVQAGLFSNPRVGAVVRFLVSSGKGTNVEAEGILPISDLWQIPYRKRVASAHLEMTLLDVAQDILEIAAQTKRAFDEVRSLIEIRKITAEVVNTFKEIETQVATHREFGLLSDQDLFLSRILSLDAEIELRKYESHWVVALTHLYRMMGLEPRPGVEVSLLETVEQGFDPPKVEEAIRLALENRVDVQIARLNVLERERALDLEKRRVVRELGAGASYEREADGSAGFGPSIDLHLPLFDQNQAQISKAQYKLRQAQKNLEALEGQVREEIVRDAEKILWLHHRLQLYREKILPLRETILADARQWVEAMQLNPLRLLEAQKNLFHSQRDYAEIRKDFENARTDLELHVGGRFPGKP